MPSLDINQAFLRFRDQGDPKDLALVFDATAAELMRVASHLASDAQVAEDLVQATFLSAIEFRHRFKDNGKGTVMSWLVAILTNAARVERRAARRKVIPELLAGGKVRGPLQEAQDSELSEAVSNAISKLPEPY